MSELFVGGHVVARSLANEGVRCIFTLCGGHIAPIYDGCLREGIAMIDTRHEQAAAHAADAWARLTRAPGVAVVTAGPGVTDAVTGIANAFQAQSPLVVLGGAAPLNVAGRGALQEMVQLPLMQSITKWAATVTDPKRIPDMMATAFRVAASGIPGPVFLELPFDVLTGQVEDPVFPTAYRGDAASAADPKAIAQIAGMIAAAQKPILFAGSQIWWDDASAALARFAEQVRIPVFLNAMGRGALAHDHAQNFSLARKKAFRQTDLAVLLGAPLDFRLGYGAAIDHRAKVVYLDRDPMQIGRNRPAAASALGNARLMLEQLADAMPRSSDFSAWSEELRGEERKLRAELEKWERSDERPINHYRLARAISDAIDPETILIGDGGDVVSLAAKIIPLSRAGQWLDPGPLGCLGVGAPFALAAKKLYPQRKVLVISGDGSFGLNGFDFETAVRHKLGVAIVVGNDAAWGQIRGPQLMIFGEERAPATSLAPTRYDKVVEAFGGRGEHVENPKDLLPAIKRALAASAEGEVTCVNVPIDPAFVTKVGASKLTV